MSYLTKSVRNRRGPTPQIEQADPRQVLNNAGGYVFTVNPLKALERFLILGTEGGTYYATQKDITKQNHDNLKAIAKNESLALQALQLIVDVSHRGRAPKNDPALFALAILAAEGNEHVKHVAYDAVPLVARTGTHLFQFIKFSDALRGWGAGLQKALRRWYSDKDADQLAYQLLKYQQREGWSHRDVLRKIRINPRKELSPGQADAIKWAVKGKEAFEVAPDMITNESLGSLPEQIFAYEACRDLVKQGNKAMARFVIGHDKLTHEMVPSELLADKETWIALLPHTPLIATVRNLGRMTANGTLTASSQATALVVSRLNNEETIAKSRIHPLQVLAALYTYRSGKGIKGSLTWEPVHAIVNALEKAYYISFGNVQSTGKRIRLALDVSGSMECGTVNGLPFLTPRVATACMAMVTMRSEPLYDVVGFSHTLVPVPISANDSLEAVVQKMSAIPFGGTDVSLPILDALKKKLFFDAFIVYTDNETWAGSTHAHEALRQYRAAVNPNAKAALVAFTATNLSVFPEDDAGTLQCVGFDSAGPTVLADFIGDGNVNTTGEEVWLD
jgi:60 kDa SS-A/Ro ribonucleoprotein